MTNCPNCGGVIDLNADKCAYCGTPYYDLSCIPLHEPFILRLNIGTKEKPQIITQKVYMQNVGITTSYNADVEYELTFIGLNPIKKR